MSSKRIAPPQLRRYQARVSLDEGMGAIYDWIQQVPAGVRPRELTNLVRLGFSVARGLSLSGGNTAPIGVPESHGPAVGTGGPRQTREESVERDRRSLDGWDIAGLLQGPPAH